MPAGESSKLPPDRREEIAIDQVRKALRGLRYGCVTLIVHNGVVVQVERTSKARLDYSSVGQLKEGEGI